MEPMEFRRDTGLEKYVWNSKMVGQLNLNLAIAAIDDG